ncbi:hypothetical protein BCT42_02185 [Vibrio lentus]|nr:hypothetical protein [Vibrio lentus]OBT22526.1 hypothetical protein A9266_10595 [Vibrio tasmaniensis]PMI39629.1 hypothetical protein BCU45_05090 [Vibrio lentus]PMI65811.1 hypothetical protein BCU40_13805 [Vibrio lentus]PMJ51047.1 hypothetical protein BCU20_10665 [Vibrio lentus]PMN07278.1 hypothetical protein BCT42_02185 [Vibrio lentus]
MASYSIEKRTLASGESRYKATVTVKHRSKIAQRFSKTHKKKTLATAWAKEAGKTPMHLVAKSLTTLKELEINSVQSLRRGH